MNNLTKITPTQAAGMLGCSPQFVREAMKDKRLPIGVAVRMPGGRWSYLIYREKLLEWMETGKEVV